MKKFVMAAFVLAQATTAFAQGQESRLPVNPAPSFTPEYAQSPVRMEPSFDMLSDIAGYHIPRLTLAPVVGPQVEWSLMRSSSKMSQPRSDGGKYELNRTGTRGLLSAAYGFGTGFVGMQMGYVEGKQEFREDGYKGESKHKGFAEPNFTLGARFGSFSSTVLLSIDHSPKIGSSIYESSADESVQDNRRGGSLTTPRLTAIFNLPTAKVGGQLGYAWFGASQKANIYQGRVSGYENGEIKAVKASLFSEGAIGAHKIGSTLGYTKVDTARVSTWALEAYGAIAVNRGFDIVPSLVYSTRGSEGDLNDTGMEIWSGSVSARVGL